ncbi:MAG TPA: 1,2-phenylacetyl-CoA epoxidase subunit PaaD [Paraburkholderia sp.]|jgi:ring-1,2-phenylacetyl-CoA epoxidase subunit PaaD
MTTTNARRHHEDNGENEGDEALAHAWTVLEAVPDPEIPVVSIRELGILRDVRRASDGALEVVVTPTYSGCPAMWQIAEDIGNALDAAHLTPYRIETVLAPAWTTDWIGADAREKLRAYGIAPPMHPCAGEGNNHTDAHARTRVQEKVIRFAPRERAAPTAPTVSTAPTASTPPCPHCGSAHTERLAQFSSTACKALYRCIDCREPFDYFKPY